jgi:hypothetical protein
MGFTLSMFYQALVFNFNTEIIHGNIFTEDTTGAINVLSFTMEAITAEPIGSNTPGGMTAILIGRTVVIRKNTSGVSDPTRFFIINETEKVSKTIS